MSKCFRVAQLVVVVVGGWLVIKGFPILGICVSMMACWHRIFDVLLNRCAVVEKKSLSDEVRRFHKDCFIADLHADVCLWRRDLMRKNRRGHVDLPRLMEGNVALQFITIPTKLVISRRFPRAFFRDLFFWGAFMSLQHPSTWFSTSARVRLQLQRLKSWVARSEGVLRLVCSRSQLDELKDSRACNEESIGLMLGLEGAHVLRGSLDVPWLFEQGFRVVGITHFNDNQFGYSAHGSRRGGLTPAGRELVRELDSHSITIDLAHASASLIDDVLEMHGKGEIRRSLIVSHTGIRGVHDHRRNISDDHAVAIAATGGLIGISLFAPALPSADLVALGKSVSYTVKLLNQAGIDGARHVAIGSDFDGAVRTVIDASGWARITAELMHHAHGLSPEQVGWIVGANTRRFFSDNLPC